MYFKKIYKSVLWDPGFIIVVFMFLELGEQLLLSDFDFSDFYFVFKNIGVKENTQKL